MTPLTPWGRSSTVTGAAPYLLLAPGVLWLAIFFVIPFGFLGYQSLQSGIFPSFEFTWEFSNFSDAISDNREQFARSFVYAGLATVARVPPRYPLVYWIAFRAGRGRTSSCSSSSRRSSSRT